MRREDFTLDVRNVDWVDEDDDPCRPTVVIDFHGPADALRERLTAPDGDLLDPDQTDVAFRLVSDLDGDDPEGVVGVTNRITGDFILELNEDADDVLRFIRSARRYGEHSGVDGQYRVEVLADDESIVTYDKNTFLVYNADGDLLRKHSLIPGGVEL